LIGDAAMAAKIGTRYGEKILKYGDKAVDVSKGTEKLRETAEIGQEAHRQIQNDIKILDPGVKIEETIKLQSGQIVRKDAIKSDGTLVIIKPNTPSGHKSAVNRENLMKDNGYNQTEKIFYDPKDAKYKPGSPTYIGPKNKK